MARWLLTAGPELSIFLCFSQLQVNYEIWGSLTSLPCFRGAALPGNGCTARKHNKIQHQQNETHLTKRQDNCGINTMFFPCVWQKQD
jgi:hypothetical protein